jgi:hypothetical protein
MTDEKKVLAFTKQENEATPPEGETQNDPGEWIVVLVDDQQAQDLSHLQALLAQAEQAHAQTVMAAERAYFSCVGISQSLDATQKSIVDLHVEPEILARLHQPEAQARVQYVADEGVIKVHYLPVPDDAQGAPV